MCMCGMTLTRRQWLTMALTASAGAMFRGKRAHAAELSAAATDVLQNTITVDTHSHARGMVFGPKMDDSLATGMRAGMLSAVCLAHVADGPVIGRTAGGGLGMVRAPAPGDLYKAHLGRLDWMDGFASGHGMRRVTTQLSNHGCKVTIPIDVAKAPEGWLVWGFDLPAAEEVNKPCESTRRPGTGGR